MQRKAQGHKAWPQRSRLPWIESSGARFWGNEAGLFRPMVFAILQKVDRCHQPRRCIGLG